MNASNVTCAESYENQH